MAAVTLAAVGAAAAVAGAASSFSQASKQNRLMSEAETKAAEALAAGKKELEKNYYAGLAIQKEPYELQREAMMGTAAQAVEAGQESERGAAATAGRIYEAAQQGQGDIRATMGKELSDLEKLKAAEESRLSGVKSGISLEEAAGYNQAAADAQRASAQAMQQGFSALQQGAQQGIQNLPLYFNKKEPKELSSPESVYLNAGSVFSPFEFQKQGDFNNTMSKLSASSNNLNGFYTPAARDLMFIQNAPSVIPQQLSTNLSGIQNRSAIYNPFKYY